MLLHKNKQKEPVTKCQTLTTLIQLRGSEQKKLLLLRAECEKEGVWGW